MSFFRKSKRASRAAIHIIVPCYIVMLLLNGIAPVSLNAAQARGLAADTGYSRFVDVTRWVGSFSWTGQGEGSMSTSLGKLEWQGNHAATGTFDISGPIFPEGLPDYVEWKGTAQATGSLHDNVTLTGDCDRANEKWDGSGDLPGKLGPGDGNVPSPMSAELQINIKTGEYLFSVNGESLDTTMVRTYYNCIDTSVDTSQFTTQLGGGGLSNGHAVGTLPSTGLNINGAVHFDEVLPQTLDMTGEGANIPWDYQWSIAPANKEKLEVQVQIPNYDTWLPEGGTVVSRGPVSSVPDQQIVKLAAPAEQTGVTVEGGNDLVINATLQVEGGGEPTQKAERFKFQLVDVSTEPGITMNAPKRADAKRDADMEFDPDARANSPLQVHVDPNYGMQTAEWIVPDSTQAHIVLRSNDWGGWGVLKVTAILKSGQEIVGYLQGDKSRTEIRLPKRTPDSWIADAWKEQNGVTGLADNSDLETVPVGDARVKGDGLTLYEEYRGFFENGVHIRTNPTVKDLFINDRVGGRSKDGIVLFARITGLNVHHLLQANEMDLGKIINFNHSDAAPHVEHESALILQQAPAGAPQSHVLGELGGKPIVPANVQELKVLPPSDMGPDGWRTVKVGGKSVQQDEYSATVAHELLHAINVKHHGEGDDESVHWAWGKDSKGKDVLTEKGVPIKIMNERGAELRWNKKDMPEGMDLWIGVTHGQHSGSDSCVMRYDNAIAYRGTGANANVRYWVEGEEPVANSLCTTSAGSGVNAANRKPQSRYGDAMDGDCAHQFIVNDIVMWTGIK